MLRQIIDCKAVTRFTVFVTLVTRNAFHMSIRGLLFSIIVIVCGQVQSLVYHLCIFGP